MLGVAGQRIGVLSVSMRLCMGPAGLGVPLPASTEEALALVPKLSPEVPLTLRTEDYSGPVFVLCTAPE